MAFSTLSLFRLALLLACLAVPSLYAQRHVWLVPGTAGTAWQAIQWDRRTGTIVAALANTLVRLDPITGARTVLHRTVREEGGKTGPGPRVLEVALHPDGAIDFTTTEGSGPEAPDTRIWRRMADGQVRLIAGMVWQEDDQDEGPPAVVDALAARFVPTALAAGPGGTLFVGDSANAKVHLLTPLKGSGGPRLCTLAGRGVRDDDSDAEDEDDGSAYYENARQAWIKPWDLAVTRDGTVLVADGKTSDMARMLVPPQAGGGQAWSYEALPAPDCPSGTCKLAADSEALQLKDPGRVAASEDGRIFILDSRGQIWAYTPAGVPGGPEPKEHRWRAQMIAGPRKFHACVEDWPPQGAGADRIDDQVLVRVQRMVAVPGGGLLLSDGRDGIRFIGPEGDERLARQVQALRLERAAGAGSGSASAPSGEAAALFRRIRAGLDGDPGVADLRAAMAAQAVGVEDPGPEVDPGRHVWQVPGTAGLRFQSACWEPATGTILAASGDAILRLDPVGGRSTLLHRLEAADREAGRSVVEAVPGPGGAIDFTIGRSREIPNLGLEWDSDGRIWRRFPDGRVRLLANAASAGSGEVQMAWDCPPRMAAGPGGELFLADPVRSRVLQWMPQPGLGLEAENPEPSDGTAAAGSVRILAGASRQRELSLASSAPGPLAEPPLVGHILPRCLALGKGGEVLVADRFHFDLLRLIPAEAGGLRRWRSEAVPGPGAPGAGRWSDRRGKWMAGPPYRLAGSPDGTFHLAAGSTIWTCAPSADAAAPRWQWIAGDTCGDWRSSDPPWPDQGAPAERIPATCLRRTLHLGPVPGGGLLLCDGFEAIHWLGPAGDAALAGRVAACGPAAAAADQQKAQRVLAALVRQRDAPRSTWFELPFRSLDRAMARGTGSLSPRLDQDALRLIGSFLVQDPAVLACRAAMAVQAIMANGGPGLPPPAEAGAQGSAAGGTRAGLKHQRLPTATAGP